MATYLLTWNPDRFKWTDLAKAANRIAAGKGTVERWSTGNTKSIRPGDEIFLLQQGSHGRGIIASGIATSAVFEANHFDKERAAKSETANYVEVKFDRLIDPFTAPERRLDVEALKASALKNINWATQSSGITIDAEAAEHLRRRWYERSGGIPEGITRDDMLAAIADLKGGTPHPFADSTGYDLAFDGDRFPPKAVLGLAARRVAGRTLTPYDFKGGDDSKCFRLLREAGFRVEPKVAGDKPKSTRNPDWARDELILALDLFFRVNPLKTDEQNPEIVSLSELLNRLPIHPSGEHRKSFRNPNGVYMKLCNFLRFDPSYSGSGLKRGNKLEKEVWRDFSGNRELLSQTAKAIRDNCSLVLPPATEEDEIIDEEEEASEGRILMKLHKRRERNPKLARKKKTHVLLKLGALACEVCTFDFLISYGDLGKGFAECHHRKPLSSLTAEGKTTLADLAIVCANCHRMLHRSKPWKSVEELRTVVQKKRAKE